MTTSIEVRAGITIAPPQDPSLRTLWDLALAKFEARTGAQPATKADWNQLTNEYNALTSKPHGSLGQVVREICEKAPGGD